MKQIKTIVNQNFETMKPLIERDGGKIPPMLFFQFSHLDKAVSERLQETNGGDIIPVENGFYIPMTSPELMENKEILFDFLNTIMSTLSILEIAGDLEFVSVALSGSAATVKDGVSPDDADFKEVYIVSGIDKNGEAFTMSQELKIKIINEIVYELVDSEPLDIGGMDSAIFINSFFDGYNRNIETIRNQGITKNELIADIEGIDDVSTFVDSMIDDAIQATKISAEAIKRYGN